MNFLLLLSLLQYLVALNVRKSQEKETKLNKNWVKLQWCCLVGWQFYVGSGFFTSFAFLMLVSVVITMKKKIIIFTNFGEGGVIICKGTSNRKGFFNKVNKNVFYSVLLKASYNQLLFDLKMWKRDSSRRLKSWLPFMQSILLKYQKGTL